MTDTHAARELELYTENEGDLHRQIGLSILKNLATKKARGQYKHDLAVKAFGYLVEAGAKKYAKEFGSPDQPWHKMFDVPTRREVAERFTKDFETEYALGNYDHLLPKKYQKQDQSTRAHATIGHAITARDIREFRGFLRNATDRQLQGIYDKERRAGRDEYAELAVAEANRRGVFLEQVDPSWSHIEDDDHARKKSPTQLDREIAEALGRRRHA